MSVYSGSKQVEKKETVKKSPKKSTKKKED